MANRAKNSQRIKTLQYPGRMTNAGYDALDATLPASGALYNALFLQRRHMAGGRNTHAREKLRWQS